MGPLIWFSGLSTIKKVSSTIAAVIGCIVAIVSVGIAVNNHWVLNTVYAGDQQQLNSRLDKTDISILQGQIRSNMGQILTLERQKQLTQAEQNYLNSLKVETQELQDEVQMLRRRQGIQEKK